MKRVILATVENGVLRPLPPYDLSAFADGQQVAVVVRDAVDPEKDPKEYARRQRRMLRKMKADAARDVWDVPASPPPGAYVPPVIEGEPLSETVIRLRREGER